MSPKVTEAYKEEKRASILAGALDCFLDKGFQATTIDDIARRLRISKGSLYAYFVSKEEIYIQLAHARMDEMVAALNALYRETSSAKAMLRHMFERFRSQPLDELRKWLTFHLEFTTYASRRPELIASNRAYMDKALRLLNRILASGKESGEFRGDLDASSAAYLFWAVRDGLALSFLLDGDETEYRRILDDMEAMVMKHLTASAHEPAELD
ncbi:TetR/AcrR family transcriptional regulator [Cohnella sp. JJ-181]|uniref:TetR/AcrR family transcriptional regulator n=1 Tax=Cohnella rhizoplanae TaxID=2974897 RepID=UPI0022FF666D|nr:TetR/AcrR family transcriptional regulator [Cohnella sp. JJ-181]CAI6083976.1 putative HTH-type transcriptional regulator YfiR [Cohnella sp. JJ-181]